MIRFLFACTACFTASLAIAAPASAQSFGSVAAVGDGEVFFGEPMSDQTPGAVYVYRRDGGSWAEAARLTASDGTPGDRFGASLDVADGRLIVGAFLADSGRGAAYVFERDAGSGAWRETAKLATSERAPGDSLGINVAIDGDLALVGAASGGSPADSAAGAVVAFRRDAGSGEWRSAGSLVATNAGPGDRFGREIELAGDTAFVGASGSDSTAGAVFVFAADGDGWTEAAVLGGPGPGTGFGSEIVASADRILIGAPAFGAGTGSVFVFEPDAESGEWQPAARLLPFAGSREPFFGASIALAGDELWIGAPGDGGGGAAYSLSRDPDTGEWTRADKIEIPDLERGDSFASAVALGEDIAAAGMPGDDYGAGTAAILQREGGEWRLAARVMSEVEGLEPIAGGLVRCAAGEAGMFDCNQVDLVAFIPVQDLGGGRGAELNDIWGWTDPESGREYALVGRVDGTAFVDISDPELPVYLGNLPKTEGSPGSTWRDIKVYENHAFIVADGAEEHGMQVFDLTRLRNVEGAPATFTEDAHYDRIHSAHNIVINTDTGFAYTVGNGEGGETCGGGLHMIDIRDPKNPQFAGCFSDPRTGRRKTGYTHDAQCVLYHGPDEQYREREICFGSNETALSIADVTDKENPLPIAVAEYPNVGYTHQAWLTEDHRYLLMDDELDELNGLVDHTRTLIWDVTDLDDPVVLEEYFNPNTTSIDHNLYVKGDKVYQSNYVAGLRILDISEIEEPVEVGYFDTVPYGSDGPRFDGSWSNYPYFESGVIVVTSGDEGLFLLRYQPAGDQPIS